MCVCGVSVCVYIYILNFFFSNFDTVKVLWRHGHDMTVKKLRKKINSSDLCM